MNRKAISPINNDNTLPDNLNIRTENILVILVLLAIATGHSALHQTFNPSPTHSSLKFTTVSHF